MFSQKPEPYRNGRWLWLSVQMLRYIAPCAVSFDCLTQLELSALNPLVLAEEP